MKILCPAKINLFLEVTGRRADGYHRLATLFAKINLYDELSFTIERSRKEPSLSLAGEGAGLSVGEDNLVMKAARLFYRAFGIGVGSAIVLEKRLPMGAGLGGGSSDAAGTLLGLAKLFDLKADSRLKKTLHSLAVKLGADVPFFLRPEPFCLGTGVGDLLKPVTIGASLPYLILAYPGIAVSTAKAYAALPKPQRSDVLTRKSQLDKLLDRLKRGRPVEEWAGLLFNRLEQAEIPELRQVESARRILERAGACGVRMSGSGSSVFGFVGSHEEGKACLERLAGYPWKVFLTSCQG